MLYQMTQTVDVHRSKSSFACPLCLSLRVQQHNSLSFSPAQKHFTRNDSNIAYQHVFSSHVYTCTW